MTFSSNCPFNKLTGESEGRGRRRREWTVAGDFCSQLPENILPLSLPLPLFQPSQSDSPPSPQFFPLLHPQSHPPQSVAPSLWNATHPVQPHTEFMHALVTHTHAGLLWQGSSKGGRGGVIDLQDTSLNASAKQGQAAMGADSLRFYWCSSLVLLPSTYHRHHLSG